MWIIIHLLSAKQSLLSDWVDSNADLTLSFTHYNFAGFVLHCIAYVLFYLIMTCSTKPLHEQLKMNMIIEPFATMSILTSVDSYEPVKPPFKLRDSK